MWGDYLLLEFYPKLWQGSMFRSLNAWLTHMSVWHYWFWLSFTVFMNFFFYIIFKVFSYQRADIRGTRSVGEKRRIAWPEMLIVIFPLFWAINIITNALAFLRVLEGNSGYVLLSVQVSGFQWGWKYYYHDTFYLKFHSNPIVVGENSSIVPNGLFKLPKLNKKEYLTKVMVETQKITPKSLIYKMPKDFNPSENSFSFFFKDFFKKPKIFKGPNFENEVYFSRWWLKKAGIFISEKKNIIKNKFWQSSYWVTAQGLNPDDLIIENNFGKNNIKVDPLRLLRSSGALVIPTRSTVRLMACSEDITHSWAVPGIGIKMDCVPGRLFCLYINVAREGIYFGQCSELCGWNHYNMPVVVYALPIEHFVVWWEIELHGVFNESIIYKNNNIKYSLLNVKYK